METKLRNELQASIQYCKQLQTNFHNNLEVIEERQAQIEALGQQVNQLQQQNQMITASLVQLQEQMQLEVSALHHEYGRKLEEKDKQMEELAVMIENRLRKQIEQIGHRHNNQAKLLKKEVTEAQQTQQRMLHENRIQQEVIREQKDRIIDLEARVESLSSEKNHYSNKMELHMQELESLRKSQEDWEQTLRNKLKEAQVDKRQLEQELSEIKLTYKEKVKRQKENYAKKLNQIADEKQMQMREASTTQKQIKYRLEKALSENKELHSQLEIMREEKQKNDILISKYKQNELKSHFDKNQKEFDMMQKMFDQNARDLKLQIQTLTHEKKATKEELDDANSKREAVEKAVERLKVELVNKSKENDQLKKDNRRLRHELQTRQRQYEGQSNNMQYPPRQINNVSHKKYDKMMDVVESVKMDGQFSKVFTDDMEYEKFFQASSPLRSPKHINKPFQGQNSVSNREAQLLKRVSELQLENQEYKNLIKNLRDEADNMRKMCQEDKGREISLYRDKANMYWEKANDKEQQLVTLKEQYAELKNTHSQLVSEHKACNINQQQLMQKTEEEERLKDRLRKLERENEELEEEVKMLEKERNLLEDVSAELRSEIHTLKELVNTNFDYVEQEESQKYSQYYPNESQQYAHHKHIEADNPSQLPRNFQIDMRLESHGSTRAKIPKKLHDLVREKKTLSISGKRAPIAEKAGEIRLEHIGTDSQKEVYEKIKVRNKTPPKVANYADLKEKRTSQIETPSQRQAFERLKNRQTVQEVNPDRDLQAGINYMQLRNQDSRQQIV